MLLTFSKNLIANEQIVLGLSQDEVAITANFDGSKILLHATTNYTVDIALAVLLLIGGVIGAQIGTQIGSKMRAEQLRILLSVLVLLVCLKLATDLLIQPSELFSLGTIGN